jgi:hypothetical protein
MVGEEGPERLKMGSLGGTIIPNEKTAPLVSLAQTPLATALGTLPRAAGPTPRGATGTGSYLAEGVLALPQPAGTGARGGGASGGPW